MKNKYFRHCVFTANFRYSIEIFMISNQCMMLYFATMNIYTTLRLSYYKAQVRQFDSSIDILLRQFICMSYFTHWLITLLYIMNTILAADYSFLLLSSIISLIDWLIAEYLAWRIDAALQCTLNRRPSHHASFTTMNKLSATLIIFSPSNIAIISWSASLFHSVSLYHNDTGSLLSQPQSYQISRHIAGYHIYAMHMHLLNVKHEHLLRNISELKLLMTYCRYALYHA